MSFENIVGNITNEENYSLLGKSLGNGYQLTESEKEGWSQISNNYKFTDFWNSDFRKQMGIGDVGTVSFNAVVSTATGRRSIKDFFYDWQRREATNYANILSDVRDSQYKQSIENGLNNDDAAQVVATRDLRGKTTIPAIQKELSNLKMIDTQESSINQLFDVTEGFLKENKDALNNI